MAIKKGLMADPNQPTFLHQAITPVGTCTSMCPEFERVERIVQKMVDKSEKVQILHESMIYVAHKLTPCNPVSSFLDKFTAVYGNENVEAISKISSRLRRTASIRHSNS